MKKYYLYVLILLLSFLIGCSNNPANSTSNNTNDSEYTDYLDVNEVSYIENAEFTSGELKGIYTGDLVNGLPEGTGTLQTTNIESGNWIYIGEWKNGFPNGQGKKIFEDGYSYEGEFVNDQIFGEVNCYNAEELIYIGEIVDGELQSLIREMVEPSEDEAIQYVNVGEIGFEIPYSWIYKEIDDNTLYIDIPEQENVKIIFSATENLDLNEDTIRESIKNEYINILTENYLEYSLVTENFNNEVVEEYNIKLLFYSDDLFNPITEVYSKSFMRGWTNNTFTITLIQDSGLYDYTEVALCIEGTLKGWEAIQEDIANKEIEIANENALQYLEDNVNWEELANIVPKVTADEIIKHNAPEEQIVLIEGIINNITDETFDLWIPYGETYYKHDEWNLDIELGDIIDGDTVEICLETHLDGSLNTYDGILAIRKVNTENVQDIISLFKDTCPKMDYKAIMRNPDNAYGTMCKVSGTVLQVIETESYMQEFLLNLYDGNLVYVAYYKEENADNILENDIVDVYGIFYFTETYTTVLGTSKTIPRLAVDYVDIN